ncbi:ribonuclease H-like domain-containing protein [Tanacetum coccineum]
MRPFRCLVTILNTIDHLGKFDGKVNEGFFVGYSLNSKAFRVFNSRTRIVEENLHIRFSKSTPNAVGSGPDWLFDIDALTRTMNYEPIVVGTQSNGFAGTKASDNTGQARKETEPVKDYILLPLSTTDHRQSLDPKEFPQRWNGFQTFKIKLRVNAVGGKTSIELADLSKYAAFGSYNIFDFSRIDEDDGSVADMNNLDNKPKLYILLGLQVKQKKGWPILFSQDKYVAKILKKLGFTKVKTASTPMETQKPLLKDKDGEEVDVHMLSP